MDISQITQIKSLEELENLRLHYFGKNGIITEQLKALGKLSPEDRKKEGAAINTQKETLQDAIQTKKQELELEHMSQQLQTKWSDITLPARTQQTG